TGGFTLGADKCYNDFLVGAAFSYTNSHLNWEKSAGNSHINSYYGGLYGNWNNHLVYVNTSLLGAFSQYDTTRHFPLRRTNRNAKSNHNGGELLAGVESGAIFKKLFCEMDLIPFISVDYVYLAQQAYSETGAGGSNLRVSSRNDQLIQPQVGIEFARRFLCGGWVIAPNLALSYVNQSPLTSRMLDVTVISLSHEFSVDGWSFERNLGELSFSLDFSDCNGMSSFAVRYDGQYGGNYWTQTASLMFNLRF
ncbi:MAG: autotransporter outer membrane beta-barrel domain-containing protein, partial [Alphaproteobacteria bacterium]|nr:autotransporter outer membrane beta-barrel domain-containing protein [Alphaproteobacteria bacterium]